MLVWKILGLKKFAKKMLGQISMGPKVGVQNNLGSKMSSGPKKMSGPETILGPKDFGSK